MTPNGAVTLAVFFAALASSQRAIAAPASIIQPTLGGTAWTADGVAKLDSDLDAMLASDLALRGAHYGVFAVDTATGMPLYSHATDDEIQPASTLKLLVGSVALDELKPTKSFHTDVVQGYITYKSTYVSKSPKPDAAIIRAGGDPFLTRADLEAAAHAVADHPFAVLRGIFVDDSRFEDNPYPAGWTWDDFGQSYAPHVSAMSLDENVTIVSVTPASTAGSVAKVELVPPATTANSPFPIEPCVAAENNYVTVHEFVVTGPVKSDDTVDVHLERDGCAEVFGSIPLGSKTEKIGVAVYDPSLFAANTFELELHRVGITMKPLGKRFGPTHPWVHASSEQLAEIGSVLWSHDSAPLSTWLGPRFWIPSDNLVGEMLLRELGYVTAGAPGTTDNGIAFEKQWLQSIGVDLATVTLADGCGMSQYDRITPRDLVTILQHDWNGPNRQLVLDSLPVGGARGTIEGIAGTDAAGRVFAKTGSMMHVRGLAGYLAPVHHGAVTFAFQVDDWNGGYPALAALRARVLSRIIDDEGLGAK